MTTTFANQKISVAPSFYEKITYEEGPITPSFSTRVPIRQIEQDSQKVQLRRSPQLAHRKSFEHFYRPNKVQGRVWERGLRVWKTLPKHGLVTRPKSSEIQKTINNVESVPRHASLLDLRIAIHPLVENHPFPQHYLVEVSTPKTNIFQRWVFTCTPYSFKSLILDHGWNIAPGDEERTEFENFGRRLKDLILGCSGTKPTHIARFEVESEQWARLSFTEVVHDYRCAHLLSLDLKASPWEELLDNIQANVKSTRDRDIQLKGQLVRLMDLVARYQPALLLKVTEGALKIPVPMQPASWTQHLRDHLLKDDIEGFLSEEEKIQKKKKFLMATYTTKDDIEPVLAKSIDLLITTDGEGVAIHHVHLTFYRQGKRNNPHSYTIRLSRSDDLGFSFTSQPITPSVFKTLTKHLSILLPPKQTSKFDPPSKARLRSHAEDGYQVLGFYPEDGVGGVLGVLGGDLLTSLQSQPERYSAKLMVETIEIKPTTNIFKTQHCKHSGNSQSYAKLIISQQIMYTERVLLDIEFLSTERAVLEEEISAKLSNYHDDIDMTRQRLDALYHAVRKQNPALLSLVGKIHHPRDELSGREEGVTETIRNLPSVEFWDQEFKVSTSSEEEYGHRYAPRVTSYPSRLPIQVSRVRDGGKEGRLCDKANMSQPRFVTGIHSKAPASAKGRKKNQVAAEGELDNVYRWASPQAAMVPNEFKNVSWYGIDY